MRVTTLKASAGGLAGLLDYYVGLAERPPSAKGPVDYYLDPDEPPGRWWGNGRHTLGLDEEVEASDLRALLQGADPRSRRLLGRRFGEASARGFDATFSAPKSVSVLWALSPDPWVRAEVLTAHDTAVDASLGYLERHGAVTRRGRDGIHQVDTRGLIVARFRQHTSRSIDPQLHTHALISAKVRDRTGRWLALDARFLKYQQRTIGWVYDAALRAELTARLGVAWGPIEGGQADIADVPESLRDLFSERTAQVEDRLADLVRMWSAEHEGADPDRQTLADLERRAVLLSRPAKVHGVDAAALHRTWSQQAHEHGFDIRILGDALHRLPGPARATDEEIVAEALRRVAGESSTWVEADLARHVATLITLEDGGAARAVERIDALAARALDRCVELSPHRVDDAPRRRDGRPVTEAVTDRRLTTQAILDQERSIQRWATASVARTPIDRSDQQQAAADAIAGPGRMVLVVGPAGTGKTTATAQGVAALRARGRPVIGLAPTGKAADVLAAEAECPTATVASFVLTERPRTTPWGPGTTVIVDEAGMVATADLA
jgi:conjugative relaxase-like TrwC/TraI family protein